MKIINAELRAGVWTAELIGRESDALQVLHEGHALDGVTVKPLAERDSAQIAVPVPSALISDGVQTFLVQDGKGQTLTSFSILAGDVLAHDLRAEIDLLRAELDMLKSAFRRHCGEN